MAMNSTSWRSGAFQSTPHLIGRIKKAAIHSSLKKCKTNKIYSIDCTSTTFNSHSSQNVHRTSRAGRVRPSAPGCPSQRPPRRPGPPSRCRRGSRLRSNRSRRFSELFFWCSEKKEPRILKLGSHTCLDFWEQPYHKFCFLCALARDNVIPTRLVPS